MNTNSVLNELSLATATIAHHNNLPYPYGCEPLSAGEVVPAFSILAGDGFLSGEYNHSLSHESSLLMDDFLDYGQPLVLFFTGAAMRTALQANKLEALQQLIQQQGGRLLMLSPTEPKFIKRQLNPAGRFTIFHDRNNDIAEAFGLYNDQNPLWQWVSGIDEEEETLPAFYVVSPDKKITYRFADFDFITYRNNHFSSFNFMYELLEAVRQSAQPILHRELYQLVS